MNDEKYIGYLESQIANILDVATHSVASLRERSFASNGHLSLKVQCHSSADLPIFSSDSCLYPRATHHSTRAALS